MNLSLHRSRRSRQKKGTALILVLAALVLISALVLTFLTNSSLSRLIAYSSAGQARADQLAQTAMGTIVGDLREEIVAGSKVDGNPTGATYTQNGIRVYVPQTNSTVVPCRVAPAADLAFPNLVKISWSTNASWSGSSYLANNAVAGIHAPVRSLPANSTASASLNQRSVSSARWNQHYLLGATVPATWQSPDWVIITRSGAVDTNAPSGTPTLAQLVNPDLSNPYRAIGRYAYAIYDEGGLIDINVAGNQLTASQNAQRGRLNQIDLGQLYDSSSASPLIPNPSALIAWRSPVSGSNTNATPGSGGLFDPQQTFLDSATNSTTSDQRFVTRNDLINYANANPSVITTQALQYLTTFSRNENIPSWTPIMNGTAGGFYNYQTNAESSTYTTSTATTVVNRDLANIRFANGGTIAATANIPGYTVTAGQPFLLQRFPLSRLTWIGRNGPNGATAADIKRAFGLVYVSRGIWNYTSPDNTTTADRIKSLNEVAALSSPRQPDFFELLQAGILQGSLGLSESYDTSSLTNINLYHNSAISFHSMADARDMERSTARQIMQIGVNLIDQVQSDNWPTTILFNWFNDPAMNVTCPQAYLQLTGTAPYIGPPFTTPASSNGNYLLGLYPGVVGVTDIPYIYSFFQTFYEHPNLGGVGQNHGNYSGMFHFVEMWNPHQNTGTYTSGPTKFRVRVEAGTSTYETYFNNNKSEANGITCSTPFIYEGSTVNQATTGPQEIDFNTSSVVDTTFRSPTILTSANSTSGPTTWTVPGAPYLSGGVNVYLFPGGYNTISTSLYGNPGGNNGTGGPTIYSFWPSFFSTSPLPTYRVDFQDESGNWSTYPYQLMPEVCYYADNEIPDNLWYSSFCHGMYRPDPRGSRWGLSQGGGNWRFNILTPTSDNSLYGQPAAYYYQRLPYSTNPNPGDPGGLFTSYYNLTGVFYSNLTWAFNDCLNPNQVNTSAANLGLLAFNQTGNITHYTDIDGLLRAGDNINGTSPDNLTTSFLSSPTAATDPRPVILHRPFRTVGEMGYAFRDMPWKTLDLFSANSADAALLDLFTVNDSVVQAGTVNLNTRQVPVLQAILKGSMQTEAAAATLSTTQANSMAQTMTNLTGGGIDAIGPVANVSELATRFLPAISSTAVAPWVKTQREAAVRTLAQIGNTRVWNLLIDLIVQSGRYPTTSSNLNNFMVEGERHYWLHVAIDRITGAVIDQSLEPVTE